jgi:hypothetical protein
VKVVDREDMPVDQNGNSADMIMDPASVIARLNLARLYEHHMNATLRDITQNVRSSYGYPKYEATPVKCQDFINTQPAEKIEATHQYLLGFYNLTDEKQFAFYQNVTTLEKKAEHVVSVISNHAKAYIPINKVKTSKEIVKAIEESIYKPVYGKVTYRGNSGNIITTEQNIRIAPLYIMLLEKIADDWTAVSTGNLQLHGLLAQVNRREKHSRPHRNTPVRTIGETEGRLFVGYCGKEAVAEMLDRSGNPLVQRHMTRNILEATQPSDINEIVDRNLVSYGNTKSVQIINHMFTCTGFRTEYVNE